MAETYQGNPCQRCGGTLRYKCNHKCVDCRTNDARKWYQSNREKCIANCKAWSIANPERVRANSNAWRHGNRNHALLMKKADYETKRPQFIARAKAWAAANPWKTKCHTAAQQANRTARRYGQGFRITGRQIQKLWRNSEQQCGICGQLVGELEWSLDHIISFEAGGLNVIENCQITHLPCNIHKG